MKYFKEVARSIKSHPFVSDVYILTDEPKLIFLAENLQIVTEEEVVPLNSTIEPRREYYFKNLSQDLIKTILIQTKTELGRDGVSLIFKHLDKTVLCRVYHFPPGLTLDGIEFIHLFAAPMFSSHL